MLTPDKMDDVLKDLSLRYYKDIRVVKFICEHPLFFVREKIKDPNDIRAITVPYFGKFVFKPTKTMADKQYNRKKYDLRIAQECNSTNNQNVTLDKNEQSI